MSTIYTLPAGSVLTVIAGNLPAHAQQSQDATIGALIEAGGTQTFGPYALDREFVVTGDGAATMAESPAYATQGLGGGGSGGALLSARAEVSSAQLLDLHNTPVELIPAPGAGKFIEVIQAVEMTIAGSAEYVIDDITTLLFYYEGLEDGPPFVSFILPGLSNKVNLLYGNATWHQNIGIFDNKALVFSAQYSSGITEGDGTIIFDILYRIVELP